MKRNRWSLSVAACALVASTILGVVAFPHPGEAEATCYLGERQTRWVTVGRAGCCDHGEIKYKQREEERHRLPDCSWSNWSATGGIGHWCDPDHYCQAV